jgi:cellulose synthase/poly-beta-1,6-N-acetylglucosamine synthase-like glycosyltransferase
VILFSAALALQLAAWALIAAGLARVRREAAAVELSEGTSQPLPISVVVAAHNEEDRLPALLDALERQKHASFEVVVVDDRSTDGTAGVVESHSRRSSVSVRQLRVDASERPAGVSGKKAAIERGVAAATYARVALTDADCQPGPDWLITIARYAATEGSDQGAVVVGYGPYHRRPGVLNAFIRYETMMTGILTAAGIALGRPFMAVGRNLSYPRDLLDRLGGFTAAAPGLSGDDDLLVQTAARAGVPVRYVLDADAHVPSEAPDSFPGWMRQKRRHASAGRRYPVGVLLALGLFHASALALWVAPLVLGWTGAGLLAGRLLFQRLVLRRAWSEFDVADLSFAGPLLDAGYAVYNAGFALLGVLPGPRAWGRR